MKKTCLIVGAGAGIGGNCAKVFSKKGYHSFLTRRTDQKGLDNLINSIRESGGSSEGKLLNIAADNVVEDLIEHIESKIGNIEVVVYNLGSQIGNKKLTDLSNKVFELGWKVATFGLFRLAKSLSLIW